MKRFPIIGMLLLIPALALTVMVGCDKGPKDKKGDDAKVDNKEKKEGNGKVVEITTATDGTIKGVVKFTGENPDKKEAAIDGHADKAKCLAGGGKHVLEQLWLVKDGLVENVVISLEPPEGKKFKITEALKKPFEKEAILDQPYCAFVPHVVGLYADVEPLLVKNSAKFSHNTKITGGVKNGDTDEIIPAGKAAEGGAKKFKKDSNPIPVQCSMHTWMKALIITFDHPYFAVTKENGAFEIKHVPVGEELHLYMWHESMGKKKDMGKITAKSGETITHDLVISK